MSASSEVKLHRLALIAKLRKDAGNNRDFFYRGIHQVCSDAERQLEREKMEFKVDLWQGPQYAKGMECAIAFLMEG